MTSKYEKIFLGVWFGIVGYIFGVIVRVFAAPINLSSISSVLWQVLPWGIPGAIIFAFLAVKFPRVFSAVACLVPGCEIS